jgi:hypothetical protein
MTDPDTVPTAAVLAAADAMTKTLRDKIDRDPHLPDEVRALAHLKLDAAMFKLYVALARDAGIIQ